MSDLATSILMVVALTVSFSVMMTVVMVLYRDRRAARYDQDRHAAQLEMLRRSFEDRLYQLTDRLTATEERWRDVNHLLISSQTAASLALSQPPKVPLTEFLKSAGVTEEDLAIDRSLVFVLTPFHPDFRPAFETVVSVCRDANLKCLRGDEEAQIGEILPHILHLLARARVVVANVDGRSPNVYYELGIAHAMDKGTILISSSVEQLPFDVRAKRIVVYSDLDDLRSKLRQELVKALAST